MKNKKKKLKQKSLQRGLKKIHIIHEMLGDTGQLLATGEHVLLHVSLTTRKVSNAADHIQDKLAKLTLAHSGISKPDGVGRYVGQPR